MMKISFFNFALRKQARNVRKIDAFVNTFYRCFEEKDQQRISLINNTHNFSSSLLAGPLSFVGAWKFPYNTLYSEFTELAYIWQAPWVIITFGIFRIASLYVLSYQKLRYKNKIYNKYRDSMELTKEQVEEIEAEIESLNKIE